MPYRLIFETKSISPFWKRLLGLGKTITYWELDWDMNSPLPKNERTLFIDDQLNGNRPRIWDDLDEESKTALLQYQSY